VKKEVPGVVVGAVIVALVALLGFLGYRNFVTRTVDSPETLSPEVKAKLNATYGGGNTKSPPGPPAVR